MHENYKKRQKIKGNTTNIKYKSKEIKKIFSKNYLFSGTNVL